MPVFTFLKKYCIIYSAGNGVLFFSAEIKCIGEFNMLDFSRYFLHEQQLFLDNISYETMKPEQRSGETKLNCKDTIVAQLIDGVGVKFNFNRALKFEPDGPFFLSVTFSVFMKFNPVYYNEIMWKNMDLAGEFKAGCPQIMSNLMARTSLLISEITSSAGQNPIVTPGGMIPAKS